VNFLSKLTNILIQRILEILELKGAKTTKTKKILKKDCNKFSSKNTFEIIKKSTEIATVIYIHSPKKKGRFHHVF
jgi:c-di-AMP phosphodiesterase-like protein